MFDKRQEILVPEACLCNESAVWECGERYEVATWVDGFRFTSLVLGALSSSLADDELAAWIGESLSSSSSSCSECKLTMRSFPA